jgi:hypothetical protein
MKGREILDTKEQVTNVQDEIEYKKLAIEKL